MTQRKYRIFIREVDYALRFFKEMLHEAMKKNDENQIVYYQGCVDSLEWLKKDHGFGKKQD